MCPDRRAGNRADRSCGLLADRFPVMAIYGQLGWQFVSFQERPKTQGADHSAT
jgi:hypothetical protein